MPGLSIPGVGDKYKTNDLVESLMKVERIPLVREQDSLEAYKNQQSAWREVNKKMSSLRDSVKSLYSFDNPFNNKFASSSEEFAVSATADRNASYEDFKIEVINPATSDRFLSKEVEKGQVVPAGLYTFKTGDAIISFKWRGGKIEDFVTSLNKRASSAIKASLIGVNKGKKALLIESLKTGKENRLIFEDAALDFALQNEIVQKVSAKTRSFGAESIVDPRAEIAINVPSDISANKNARMEFFLGANAVEDVALAQKEKNARPEIPGAGFVAFGGVEIQNEKSKTLLPPAVSVPAKDLEEVRDNSILFVRFSDGSEKEIFVDDAIWNFSGERAKIVLSVNDYPDLLSIVLRNRNTGASLLASEISVFDNMADLGYEPMHAVSKADDAVLKYEGIRITRPENTIDDIVPGVTLHINDKTERAATISVSADTESAKSAIINFVGKYNQILAEINVLSQNKQEIIDELDYLTDDERSIYAEKLGLFFNDFSLASAKNSMQSIIAARYDTGEEAAVNMLSQIGISTNATNYSGYNPGKMRGYLEIDETKLDENLRNNMNDIKRLFGFDADGDLVVDSGIGYLLDKQLTSYVQTGGILAAKSNILDRQIDSSQKKITKLENQLADKEASLKNRYGQMEGVLNNLESQRETLSNFGKQRNRE